MYFCLPEQIEIISAVFVIYGILRKVDLFTEQLCLSTGSNSLFVLFNFDNYRDCAARPQNDRLAAINEVWNKLVSNLRRFYVSEDTLTVDEQVVDYRGTISGRTYIASKPRKYGVKIFWLCEAKSDFPLNVNIYIGKVSNEVVSCWKYDTCQRSVSFA